MFQTHDFAATLVADRRSAREATARHHRLVRFLRRSTPSVASPEPAPAPASASRVPAAGDTVAGPVPALERCAA